MSISDNISFSNYLEFPIAFIIFFDTFNSSLNMINLTLRIVLNNLI